MTIQQKKSEAQESMLVVNPLLVAMPAPSLPKKNVVAYMAGYLLRQNPVDSCKTCAQLFKLESVPESSPVSDYEFIRCKTYKDTSHLLLPSTEFTGFIQTLEAIFCSIFGGVMYMKDVLQLLCKSTEEEVVRLHRCGRSDCLTRLHSNVKLYLTVRIHHALKVSNIGTTYGHKRNCKILKLCHE